MIVERPFSLGVLQSVKGMDHKDVGLKMEESKAGLSDQTRWRPQVLLGSEGSPPLKVLAASSGKVPDKMHAPKKWCARAGSHPQTGFRAQEQFSTLRTVFLVSSRQVQIPDEIRKRSSFSTRVCCHCTPQGSLTRSRAEHRSLFQ